MAQVANWVIARPVAPDLAAAAALASWNVQFGWRWMFTAVDRAFPGLHPRFAVSARESALAADAKPRARSPRCA